MNTRARRLGAIVAVVVLATMAATAGGLAWVSPAHAATDPYCGASYVPGGSCYGPRHSLQMNFVCWYPGQFCPANPPHLEAAAALNVNLQMYGNWVYGWVSACHPYSGANLLYPWLYNPEAAGQSIMGWESYGTGASTC